MGATAPPPVLLTTNLVGVPAGEPTLIPLRTTSRARPLQFALISGVLPPGLALETAGGISGQASSVGTFDARLRLTDLLGQNTTQALHVVTVPLPPSGATPWVENVRRAIGSDVHFDVVGGAGVDCLVERSTNLANWAIFVTTNAPTNRLTLQIPVNGNAAFFRVSGMGDGTTSDAQAQTQNVPTDPMNAADQEVEKARQECLVSDCGSSSDELKDKLVALYIQMADQVVLPKLKNAVEDPADVVLDDALLSWTTWLRRMQLLGLDQDPSGDDQTGELAKRLVRASGLASLAISKGMDKACQDCMRHDVWRIYRMLDLARRAELIGWNFTDEFWNCARKCLVFELTVESEIVSSDGTVINSTHTKGKAKLRPQSLDGKDAASVDIARLMLVFTGSGQWDITEMQATVPAKCALLSAPVAGRLDFPWVRIDLYKKRQIWVPGDREPRTVYVFDPDMTVKMRSGLEVMPKEGLKIICPKGSPLAITDMFGHLFHLFHNNELQIPAPGSVGEAVLDGPVFSMTGFAPGGPEDVILSKPYAELKGDSVENTLIELRHHPEQ